MDFNLDDKQVAARDAGEKLGRALAGDAAAGTVIESAAQAGLLDVSSDLLAMSLACEALAYHSPSAAVAFALHTSLFDDESSPREDGAPPELAGMMRELRAGAAVGAVALSSEETPEIADGRLRGRASFVAPLTATGVAMVGVRSQATGGRAVHRACLVRLSASGVALQPVQTAALRGLVCGHVQFDDVAFVEAGETQPVMAHVRILFASAGLGMGRRALNEAMAAARNYIRIGAGGEQTVQGLLADAATELEAARLLIWKAASAPWPSLADASAAKLLATEATQRAVARATQVIGGETFRRGHIVEQLAQDVRALELFAGRTEALREAVADEVLPRPPA
jgi:alkylation response protein AidB-like acyl-CoA dehydrogenase